MARALLLSVLLYVGFDLCMPDLPGAFTFDPSPSVESVDRTRGRQTLDEGVTEKLPPVSLPVCLLHDAGDEPLAIVPPVREPVVTCLARARCSSSRSLEDAH